MSDPTGDSANPVTSGLDPAKLEAWLLPRLPGATSPLDYEQITGGLSNLTYFVRDHSGREWVLRRPPTGMVLPTAHDVVREHRILSALGPTPVAVPPTVLVCEDTSVIGAPFFVMDKVDGVVVRDPEVAGRLDPGQRQDLAMSLIDTLVEIHRVDLDAVGLGDLVRSGSYVERQLRRWNSQLEKSQTRELPILHDVHAKLIDRLPAGTPSVLIHGDFRLDNCIIDLEGPRVAAVLDWELCTVGDPMADLAQFLAYWVEPDDEIQALPDSPTLAGGFPDRAAMLARYSEVTGSPVTDPDYYMAFAYWRLACILEGVVTRYREGVMGGQDEDGSTYERQVDLLGQLAHSYITDQR